MMSILSQELAEQIACLLFDTDFQYVGRIELHNKPIAFDRYTDWNSLLASFTVYEPESANPLYPAYHVMIMKNGDVHARTCPYYDGVRDGTIMIHNQVKIHQLIEPLINGQSLEARYKIVHDEMTHAFRTLPLSLMQLPAHDKEIIVPPGYETIFRDHYMNVLGLSPPEKLTYRGVSMRTESGATSVIVQLRDPRHADR